MTDASFWNEQAIAMRSNRSTASASTPRAGRRSDRALALAADDLERDVALPVDEVVHRLEAELDRQREVADLVLERRRARRARRTR